MLYVLSALLQYVQMVRTHMSQYYSLSLYALSLNSMTDAYGQVHSLPSLLIDSTFGKDIIWQTESWWGSSSESNEKEIAQLLF